MHDGWCILHFFASAILDFRRIFSNFHQLLVGLWPGEELEGSDASEDSERVLSSEFGDVSSPDPTDQTDKTRETQGIRGNVKWKPDLVHPAPTMSYTETCIYQAVPASSQHSVEHILRPCMCLKCYIVVHRWFAMFSIAFLFLFDFRREIFQRRIHGVSEAITQMDPLELRFSQRKMRNVTGRYQPLAYLATFGNSYAHLHSRTRDNTESIPNQYFY
jgi:hypothetical protein